MNSSDKFHRIKNLDNINHYIKKSMGLDILLFSVPYCPETNAS